METWRRLGKIYVTSNLQRTNTNISPGRVALLSAPFNMVGSRYVKFRDTLTLCLGVRFCITNQPFAEGFIHSAEVRKTFHPVVDEVRGEKASAVMWALPSGRLSFRGKCRYVPLPTLASGLALQFVFATVPSVPNLSLLAPTISRTFLTKVGHTRIANDDCRVMFNHIIPLRQELALHKMSVIYFIPLSPHIS